MKEYFRKLYVNRITQNVLALPICQKPKSKSSFNDFGKFGTQHGK